MAGIDKIIKQIEENTAFICDDMIADARQKADRVIDEAKQNADRITADSAVRIENAVKDIVSRAESSAALEERRIALQTKQSIIGDMIVIAKGKLLNLPDDEYFALILSMIEKNASDSDGIICFNQRDLDRMPKGFEQQMNSAAAGTLTLSKDPIRIDSGFVLVYGGIEENCSFDAIFTSRYEQILDRATRLLF